MKIAIFQTFQNLSTIKGGRGGRIEIQSTKISNRINRSILFDPSQPK